MRDFWIYCAKWCLRFSGAGWYDIDKQLEIF